jgi:hypothetical protein
VQHPEVKLNHALVLGGNQGIGKDTILEPVKRAVGAWNFKETTPSKIMGRFNPHLKAVVLRISEARDLGEFDRYKFYDHTKNFIAAPPDVQEVDEKNLREHYIVNVVGVIITTNHKSNGIYLPADDRRHYVAWSNFDKTMFTEEYWNGIWKWYAEGGLEIVARYLMDFDLAAARFNPKAPPPQTEAFWEIVSASSAPEDAEMADALDALARQIEKARLVKQRKTGAGQPDDVVEPEWRALALTAEQKAERDRLDEQVSKTRLEWPDAVTIEQVRQASTSHDFSEYLKDRRNSRKIPYRLEACGYTAVKNPDAKDGQWVLEGRRQALYVRTGLGIRERLEAAQAFEATLRAMVAAAAAAAAAAAKAREELEARKRAEAEAAANETRKKAETEAKEREKAKNRDGGDNGNVASLQRRRPEDR